MKIYLSPQGDDQLSGLQLKTSGAQGPLKSLQEALVRIRSLRSVGTAVGAVEICMSPGTYMLERPVIFHAQDSNITVRGSEEEPTMLSGSIPLSGFQPVTLQHGIKAWSLDISTHLDRYGDFRALFHNGQRLQRARWPHRNFLIVDRFAHKHEGIDITEGQHRFFAKSEDLPSDWQPGDQVEVNIIHYWVHERAGAESINPQTGEIVMDRKTGMNPHFGPFPTSYFLENDLRFLIHPGDWFLDQKTGTLYIVPEKKWNRKSFEVHAPVVNQWIRLAGEVDRPVQNVSFHNLTFQHADWCRGDAEALRWEPHPEMPPRPTRPILPHRETPTPIPRPSNRAIQGAVYLPGTIQGRAAAGCHFSDCCFSGSSFYTFLLEDGSRGNVIERCRFEDLGAGAVYLDGSPDMMEPKHHNVANRISDCEIRSGGHVFADACGIFATHVSGCRIEHNHIEDFPYTGISVGWRWTFDTGVNRDQQVVGNVVRKIGHRGGLSDMGGIYLLGYQPGSVVRGNVVEDIRTVHYGGWGIYLDEGSSGIQVEHNQVWKTASHSVHEHWGRQNIYRHNLFAFGGQGGIMINHETSHGWVTHPAPGSRAEYNILLTDGQPAFHDDDGLLNNQDIQKGFFSHDHNLMWDEKAKARSAVWKSSDWHDPKYKERSLSLKQAQALGQELNGLITDPKISKKGRRITIGDGAIKEQFPCTRKLWSKAGPRKVAKNE